VAALTLALGSARSQQPKKITVKGSDTMILVAQRWAEIYMKSHPEVQIQVTGGGSGTGIAALINGTCDIANSSRPIKGSEKQKASQFGSAVMEYKVAQDALSVVVNAKNSVGALTLQQIGAIFTGEVNNWKEVGGADAPIVRYSREANSGTYVFFKEHVLKNADYAADCQTLAGTAAVAEAVANDANAIGYGGVAYFATRPACKILRVKKDANSPAVWPLNPDRKSINFDAVYDGSYGIARYLYCYTPGKQKPGVKEYLEWIGGLEGQKIASELDYIPLKK
jgi:phosphate transport system substrate-binding protein